MENGSNGHDDLQDQKMEPHLEDSKYQFENLETHISNYLIQHCPAKNFSTTELLPFFTNFAVAIRDNIRGVYTTDQEFDEKVQSVGTFGSLCGRLLSFGELYFRCFDCDLIHKNDTSNVALQCRQCFEKSNHEGHKVATELSGGGALCDCGDIEAWNKQGFCTDHQGFSSEKVLKMMSLMPSDAEQAFLSTFSELFYLTFRLIEDNDLKEVDIHSHLMNLTGGFLSEYCKKGDGFKLLTSKFLTSTLNEKWLWKHDCDDLKKLSYRESKGSCKCTALELLFRFGNYLSEDCQSIFKDLFIELFVDHEFKKYFTVIYTKMIYFCYIVEAESEINQRTHDNILEDPIWNAKNIKCSVSKISRLFAHVLWSEEMCLIAVKSGYFHHYFDLIRRMLFFSGAQEHIDSVATLLRAVLANLLYIFSQPAPSNVAAQKSETFEAVFALLMDIQCSDRFHFNEFFFNVKDPKYVLYSITRSDLSNRILEVISAMVAQVFNIEDGSLKEKIISNFVALLTSNYKKCKENSQVSPLFNQGKITMNPILFHVLGILVSYLIVEHLDLTFNDEELQIIWEDALYESLKSLIFFKALSNINESVPDLQALKPFLMIVQDLHFSPDCSFSDYEVLLAQISILMMRDKSRVRAVMKNLLSYTADEKDPNSAGLGLIWKRTCFEVFTFVMKDESSYARIHKGQLENGFKAAVKAKPLFNAIAQKIIVNYLHISPFQKFEEIESGINPCIRLKDDQHILDSIVDVSKQTQKLRLREEWQNKGIDPQIFYKCKTLDQEFQAILKEIAAKDTNFNIILGCAEPRSLLYLRDVERTACLWVLFDLETFSQIVLSFVEGKVDIAGAIRFISICMGVLEKFSYKELENAVDVSTLRVLKEIAEKIMLKVKSAKEYEEYSFPLVKLRATIERTEKKLMTGHAEPIMATEEEEKKTEVKFQLNEDSEDRRNKMLQKQREIKERFMKKQKDFITKSLAAEPTENQDSTHNENGEKNSVICNYCHEIIKTEAEKYGYLAFLSRNNFPDYCKLFKEESRTQKSNVSTQYNLWQSPSFSSIVKATGSFTISSCHHYMHNNCFELFQKKKTNSPHKTNRPDEFFCIFCKALCNIFVPVLSEAKTGSNLSTTVENMEKEDLSLKSIRNTLSANLKDVSKGIEVTSAKLLTDYDSNIFGDQLFITNLTNCKRLGFNEFAEQPEDIVRMMVLQYAEMIEVISLQRFYNSKAQLLKACATLIRNLYWQQAKQYESALADKLFKLKNDACRLIPADNESIEDAVTFAKEFIFESKNSTQIILEAIWNMYFVEGCLEQNLNKLVSNIIMFGAVLELLKLFIEDKLLEDPKAIVDPESVSPIDSFKKYVTDNIDFELPSLLSYLRKIVVVTSSIGCCHLNSDYKDLLTCSQILSALLNLEKSNYPLKDLLEQFLVTNEKTFETIFKGVSEYIKRKSDFKAIKIPNDCLQAADVALISLPEDYQKFKALFQREKCQLCNEFLGRGTICLICGKFMCLSRCEKAKTLKTFGNLNEHARESHCGIAAFIDTELSFVFFLNSPKNEVFRQVYENKYGQSIDRLNQKVEWRDYKLNEQVINEIKNLVIENQIPQKVCRLIDEDKQGFKSGEL